MKVIYYSHHFFADCDFPLVKALQDKGVDVHYYMPLEKGFRRGTIIELDSPIKKSRFIKASKVPELKKFKECIDLDRLYLIQGSKWPYSIWLWLYTVYHMNRLHADVFHFTWQFTFRLEKLIPFFLRVKNKVMTVHDPISHSGMNFEKNRMLSFQFTDSFILLNQIQAEAFSKMYNIPDHKIYYSQLGSYETIRHVSAANHNIRCPYVLYFGSINQYKGIEYLLKAMKTVHDERPDIHLIIAGGGKFYFDVSDYQQLDYVHIFNRYVGIQELAGFLKDALFTICPYKDATQSGVVQTSLAMDVPVVATRVGNMPEVVKDGHNGLIVPPCDSKSLSSAILRLINDTTLLNTFKDNIKKDKSTYMSWNNIAEQYLKVYEQFSEGSYDK